MEGGDIRKGKGGGEREGVVPKQAVCCPCSKFCYVQDEQGSV